MIVHVERRGIGRHLWHMAIGAGEILLLHCRFMEWRVLDQGALLRMTVKAKRHLPALMIWPGAAQYRGLHGRSCNSLLPDFCHLVAKLPVHVLLFVQLCTAVGPKRIRRKS